LDENLTPAANAQQYFKKYRKKKSTCENAERNIGDALSEHEYLKSVETLLDNCIDNQDIAQIKEELISAGYLSATQKGSRKVQKKRSDRPEGKHLVLTVSDGYEVWIGKNNVQNDLITGKLSASNDVWLHVKNAPGSHVILRTSLKGGEFTKASIEDAAKLAALHSSLKGASKTEVDFTRVKYVKKPVGSRPGKVIYTNQKTIVTE
jgi:predicted ribosome quality control (RQC) complex YloA/Tae2 family protein